MVFNKQLKKIKFSTVLTIFEFCFLYLLKTVEIVIIQPKQGGIQKNAATSIESFGKSSTYFLRAVHVGRDEFCGTIHCFYCNIFNRFGG